MVNVDISNVWTCVSLPELLGCEKDVFDAHNRLRDHTEACPDYMGWLRLPTSAANRLVEGINQVARTICEHAEVLVICGCGGAYHGAKAAVEAYCGAGFNMLRTPKILFVGTALSASAWTELTRLLQDRDYSLLILSPDGSAVAPNVAARGLRWMMERKYGAQAKKRIFVATMVGTSLHTMAQEEGYELFPLPKQPGGFATCLTAAALLPMAVAGIDPQAVMEGAAAAERELDIRSFENPAWLYGAARHVLAGKGKNQELLCLFEPALEGVGHWWQRTCRRQNIQPMVQTMVLPGDLENMEAIALSDGGMFETVLRFDMGAKKVPVEMDWKDYDGLGFLSGRTVDDIQAAMTQALIEGHYNAGVPVLDLDAGELTAENLGGMFCFFELVGALQACMEAELAKLELSSVERMALDRM